MNKANIYKLILSILLCQFAGIIGSVFTFSSIPTWYVNLQKPEFAPPNWVFAPIWIILYALMGISLYLILNKGLREKRTVLGIKFFAIQLFLNALWSVIFFGLQNQFIAFIEIIILWVFICLTILEQK